MRNRTFERWIDREFARSKQFAIVVSLRSDVWASLFCDPENTSKRAIQTPNKSRAIVVFGKPSQKQKWKLATPHAVAQR